MKCLVTIGNSNYTVVVQDKGGKVFVGKDNKILYRGQWIPLYGKLMLDCPFDSFSSKIEQAITKNGVASNVVWPYISEKYR